MQLCFDWMTAECWPMLTEWPQFLPRLIRFACVFEIGNFPNQQISYNCLIFANFNQSMNRLMMSFYHTSIYEWMNSKGNRLKNIPHRFISMKFFNIFATQYRKLAYFTLQTESLLRKWHGNLHVPVKKISKYIDNNFACKNGTIVINIFTIYTYTYLPAFFFLRYCGALRQT